MGCDTSLLNIKGVPSLFDSILLFRRRVSGLLDSLILFKGKGNVTILLYSIKVVSTMKLCGLEGRGPSYILFDCTLQRRGDISLFDATR